jgi:hypothetical protein
MRSEAKHPGIFLLRFDMACAHAFGRVVALDERAFQWAKAHCFHQRIPHSVRNDNLLNGLSS